MYKYICPKSYRLKCIFYLEVIIGLIPQKLSENMGLFHLGLCMMLRRKRCQIINRVYNVFFVCV